MSYDINNLSNTLLQIFESANEQEMLSDEERKFRGKKAAYALNLCTVSVSQIIDYDDIAVMEQEYEAILNNINLQKMPKDQALLNILNHLMDTITFFRIEEKEKKLVEKKYANQIRKAIWNAVPNLSILTDWSNPLDIAVTVGLSYMNYRRQKMEYQLEKEIEDFRLEKSAMDQFNNLRRELFNTSWRLAKIYNFEDEFRLSEKQIEQYNQILQDVDVIRRFERLESIMQYFSAYPPYWYYLGHTAIEIVKSDKKMQKLSSICKQKYLSIAKKAFDTLLEDKLYDILREDPIVSACALEYVDILDARNDREKIEKLIEKALMMSGNAYDIWQLCALAYLRIDKLEEACTLLRKLVNERYLEELNAQLLSSLYVKIHVYSGSTDILEEYATLALRTKEYDLFEIPSERSIEAYSECEREFIRAKKIRLKSLYGNALLSYMRKTLINFSKLYKDYSYRKVTDTERIVSFFNLQVLIPLYELPGMTDRIKEETLTLFSVALQNVREHFVFENNEKVNAIDDLYMRIVFPGFQYVGERVCTYLDTAQNLSDIAELDSFLSDFYDMIGVEKKSVSYYEDNQGREFLLDKSILGIADEASVNSEAIKKNAKELFGKYEKSILTPSAKSTSILINKDSDDSFVNYFRDKLFEYGSNRMLSGQVIAVIVDKKGHDDILITARGIRRRYGINSISQPIRFDEVDWGKKGREEIYFGTGFRKKYKNEDVNLANLLSLFRELTANAKDLYNESDKLNPFSMLIKL